MPTSCAAWRMVTQALLRRGVPPDCLTMIEQEPSFAQLMRPPVPAEPGAMLSKKVVWRNFPPAHVWSYRSG